LGKRKVEDKKGKKRHKKRKLWYVNFCSHVCILG
jgi:hypothetical protein